jgi:hypothetical protein
VELELVWFIALLPMILCSNLCCTIFCTFAWVIEMVLEQELLGRAKTAMNEKQRLDDRGPRTIATIRREKAAPAAGTAGALSDQAS